MASVLIYQLFTTGGAGKAATQYANALAGLSHDVRIVTARVSPQLRDALCPSVSIDTLDAGRSLGAVTGLRDRLRQLRPDTVLTIGVSNMFALEMAMYLSGHAPAVVLRETNSPSGLLQKYRGPKRWVKPMILRRAYRRADRVIALTNAMAFELERDWKVPAQAITMIPNGVDFPRETSPRPDNAHPVILSVARLSPQKDIATLLRAFAAVRCKREARLKIAGDGRLRGDLEALSRDLGISDDVEFLGHQGSPARLYAEADLTVLSSHFEGFPNVLIEALAQGCPIVATDCPTGPAEIIQDESVGKLARVGDPEDLARAINAALDTRFETPTLYRRANDFSEDRMRETIAGFFQSMTGADAA